MNRLDNILWFFAFIFFIGGDSVTTYIGLQQIGVVEAGPLAVIIIDKLGFIGMVITKIAVFYLFYKVYSNIDSDIQIGIPYGLTILGILATAWNSYVITQVI